VGIIEDVQLPNR